MLTRVRFEGYRCLRDVSLELTPFTVLVGPNGTGKSTILEGLDWDFQPKTHRFNDAKLRWARTIWTESGASWCQETGRPKAQAKYSYRIVRFGLESLRAANTVEPSRGLSGDGRNLANALASLPRRVQEEVSERFCALVPVFRDVDVRPAGSGSHHVLFEDRWHPGLWYDPGNVSDGSLLALAYLLLQYDQQPPDLLAIEEPERGLHPYLMEQIIGLLRAMTDGSINGRKTQIIAATHSAELLEHLEPEEVRFVRRRGDTGDVEVTSAPTNVPEWRTVYDEYQRSLGSLWLSGNLGGASGA